MKFRFCGDLDCPDWVLAEMTTLSKLTSVKVKLLCVQLLKPLVGSGDVDFEKVLKLTSDAKLELGDVKGCVAALTFIITNAAKYAVDEESLSNELQQLGLPKEHALTLCKVYADNAAALKDELLKKSLRLNELQSVDWRLDYIIGSSVLTEVNEPSVQLRLRTVDHTSGKEECVSFTCSPDKIKLLLHELKQAESLMDNLAL